MARYRVRVNRCIWCKEKGQWRSPVVCRVAAEPSCEGCRTLAEDAAEFQTRTYNMIEMSSYPTPALDDAMEFDEATGKWKPVKMERHYAKRPTYHERPSTPQRQYTPVEPVEEASVEQPVVQETVSEDMGSALTNKYRELRGTRGRHEKAAKQRKHRK